MDDSPLLNKKERSSRASGGARVMPKTSKTVSPMPRVRGFWPSGRQTHEATYLLSNINELIERLNRINLSDCCEDDRLFWLAFAGKDARLLRQFLARAKAPAALLRPGLADRAGQQKGEKNENRILGP